MTRERYAVTAWAITPDAAWRGTRRVDRDGDPWAHAEVVALRRAGRRRTRLVLSTLEPCVTCAGQIAAAGARGVAWACADGTSGAWTMGLAPAAVTGVGPRARRRDWQPAPEMQAWRRRHPRAPWPRVDWWWWDWGVRHAWTSCWDVWEATAGRLRPSGHSPWMAEADRVLGMGVRRQVPLALTWVVRAWGFHAGPRRLAWHRTMSRLLQEVDA